MIKADWIPVSVRKPEEPCHVWATCVSKIDNREPWVCELYFFPHQEMEWSGTLMVAWGEAEVIAWADYDVPEPYKPRGKA